FTTSLHDALPISASGRAVRVNRAGSSGRYLPMTPPCGGSRPMGMLDHWHPVLRSRDLRRKPVGVKVAGVPIAVFRTGSGGVGAVADACPHRRLKLSVGAVVGDRLRCQYHGWSFDV